MTVCADKTDRVHNALDMAYNALTVNTVKHVKALDAQCEIN
ncbi:hypothetical protein P106B_92 [Rhizobium phage vB_RglS_P106B]|uniref:Uncharacterized protein n=1 Tax=Rhizobium phage vB_RglS_P106B TaxID=1458697 RepID=W6E8K6_9CAUD|nr:hypothetical protein P106B_92 [Rhizobium phage vB_RglS_P106B]AHJ10775.1 hypothetical protein P106B_92 [Rhizobium phage vB_RglS_P106B]